MNKTAALIAALLLFCPLPSLAQKKASSSAQKKTPAKAIRFEGAPQYPQEELLAASGLKPGVRLTPSDVRAHAKQLNDTGFFAVVKFTTDSKGLLLTLTPASQLFSIHLDNLPLKPGKELDDQLHAQFPLFHGLVPANGSVVDGIRQTFEEMLANQGIKATVKAEVTSGLGPSKITAMNFTVVSPPVRIGPIQLSGVSTVMQAKVNALVYKARDAAPRRETLQHGKIGDARRIRPIRRLLVTRRIADDVDVAVAAHRLVQSLFSRNASASPSRGIERRAA